MRSSLSFIYLVVLLQLLIQPHSSYLRTANQPPPPPLPTQVHPLFIYLYYCNFLMQPLSTIRTANQSPYTLKIDNQLSILYKPNSQLLFLTSQGRQAAIYFNFLDQTYILFNFSFDLCVDSQPNYKFQLVYFIVVKDYSFRPGQKFYFSSLSVILALILNSMLIAEYNYRSSRLK